MTPGRIVLLCLIPISAAVVGGLGAAWRRPGPVLRSAIQHLSAGIVFAAAALELLPAVRAQGPVVAVTGFAIGTMTMLALRRTTRRLEENATDGSSIGMIVAIGLDLVIDGLVTGSGFALGERTGLLLIIALVLEYLFLGLAIASGLGEHASRWAIVLLPSGLAVLTIPAALLGFMVLGAQSPAVLGGFLAFGTVAMLYLVTEELLREAHEETDTEWATALFFVGFLIFLIISELG